MRGTERTNHRETEEKNERVEGRTLSRENFHVGRNELTRDHKSCEGKSNETTTGYKSLWCLALTAANGGRCASYISAEVKLSEHRGLLRTEDEGRSTRTPSTSEEGKSGALRSVFQQYWSSALFARRRTLRRGPLKNAGKGKIVIYDLLRGCDLLPTRGWRSVSRGGSESCLFIFFFFVFVRPSVAVFRFSTNAGQICDSRNGNERRISKRRSTKSDRSGEPSSRKSSRTVLSLEGNTFSRRVGARNRRENGKAQAAKSRYFFGRADINYSR